MSDATSMARFTALLTCMLHPRVDVNASSQNVEEHELSLSHSLSLCGIYKMFAVEGNYTHTHTSKEKKNSHVAPRTATIHRYKRVPMHKLVPKAISSISVACTTRKKKKVLLY